MSSDESSQTTDNIGDTHDGAADIRPDQAHRRPWDIFAIPAPLKRVFDRFPLVVYPSNEAPLQAPSISAKHVLHVFSTKGDARLGRPSFNPACLKWQTYLKIAGIDYALVPSSNHASPSGALPFLSPGRPGRESVAQAPVPHNKLMRWLDSEKLGKKSNEVGSVRSDAYASLLDNPIRKAWLYQLYLNPANYQLVKEWYLVPCSSNLLVQATIVHQLRAAAEQVLASSSNSSTIVVDDVMTAAAEAFSALSTLLGPSEWFFEQKSPSLFDASVFAYTHLILDDSMHWVDNKLAPLLKEHDNLVQHAERISRMYY